MKSLIHSTCQFLWQKCCQLRPTPSCHVASPVSEGQAGCWLSPRFVDGDTEALKAQTVQTGVPAGKSRAGTCRRQQAHRGREGPRDRGGCGHHVSGDGGSWGPGMCSSSASVSQTVRREFGESESCDAGAQGNIKLHQMARSSLPSSSRQKRKEN